MLLALLLLTRWVMRVPRSCFVFIRDSFADGDFFQWCPVAKNSVGERKEREGLTDVLSHLDCIAVNITQRRPGSTNVVTFVRQRRLSKIATCCPANLRKKAAVAALSP